MTVSELIEFLKTQPQDLDVAYCKYSDACLLEASDIYPVEMGITRPDGWVHNKRPDQPSKLYLLFPGN